MAYAVIKIYSFECDHPGCEATNDCAGPELRDALKELRYTHLGWAIFGRGRDCRIFCPNHKGLEMARRGKAAIERAEVERLNQRGDQ